MASTNPLLTGKRLPGSRFQLPSQGQFYDNGELSPDVMNGEVMVFPMTTYDEILFKSPDLLLTGEAIQRVFERCIPDILKPLELLSGDVDFLTICLRSISFGNDVTINHSHSCDPQKTHEYTLSIGDFCTRTKMIDSTMINQQYVVDMGGDVFVHFTPIRYNAMMEYLQLEHDDDFTPEILHDISSRQLAKLISYVEVKIEGTNEIQRVRDRDFIVEWIKQLDLLSVRKIDKKMQSTTIWGTDIKHKLSCKGCKEEIELIIPLNPMHFFTQR